jgi:hypothetical protein
MISHPEGRTCNEEVRTGNRNNSSTSEGEWNGRLAKIM